MLLLALKPHNTCFDIDLELVGLAYYQNGLDIIRNRGLHCSSYLTSFFLVASFFNRGNVLFMLS